MSVPARSDDGKTTVVTLQQKKERRERISMLILGFRRATRATRALMHRCPQPALPGRST